MTSRESKKKNGGRQVVDQLFAYLKNNPNAADTLEGIAACWLPQAKARSKIIVLRALETLVAEGRVEKCILPDARCVFRSTTTTSKTDSN